MTDLAAYLADNYGRCIASICVCRRDGKWLGTGCLHWKPVKAKTFEELKVEQRAVPA